MKAVRMRPLAVTFAEDEPADQTGVVTMIALASLCGQLDRLNAENNKLKRALQREAHHMDQRVIRNR